MSDPAKPDVWSRRDFLKRAARAGAAVVATASAGYLLYDSEGPGPGREPEEAIRLPDFSVRAQSPRMCVVRGDDRRKTLAQAFKALGGIEAFIKKGDRVLLKVNAAFAAPPALAATTHPQLVAEVARQCFAAGARSVRVTDNPINDPASCFMLSGIEQAAREAGAGIDFPHDASFTNYTLPGGRLIVDWPLLYEPLRRVDKLIGLAPVKDHHRSGASMTLKNWYGLLGGRRNIFHQNIHDIIKELAVMIRPTLVILDGTVAMMKNGPTGGSLADLKPTRTLIVGTDPVAADAFGATLLDKNAAALPFLAKAEQAGAGTVDYRALKPIVIDA